MTHGGGERRCEEDFSQILTVAAFERGVSAGIQFINMTADARRRFQELIAEFEENAGG